MMNIFEVKRHEPFFLFKNTLKVFRFVGHHQNDQVKA